MLRYKIVHHTYYLFSGIVSLKPHSLRLRPREDHELRIESSTLSITPSATLLWHRDVEGNSVAIATFAETASRLAIESEVVVQHFNENPLDFLVADYGLNYPFAYLDDDRVVLFPYLAQPNAAPGALLSRWLGSVWSPGEKIQTYGLLERLNAAIHEKMAYRIREEPGVQNPEYTLEHGSGSCRDFAVLFMEAARLLGLAARFVSGYLHAPPSPGYFGATHAWAEVYLPGAGWIGFDPTTGGLVGTDHIAVAVARLPEAVPPIAGSFAGPPGASLEVGVWVSRI